MLRQINKAITQYVPDYKVNLIAPGHMSEDETGEFKTSLKEVMLYIKYSKDKTKLLEVTQTDPEFRNLDRQAAEVINVTTNSRLRYPEGKEKIDMCVAIEEMRMDSRLEGELEGTVKTCKKLKMSQQETIEYLIDNYSLSLQESGEKVHEYWK